MIIKLNENTNSGMLYAIAYCEDPDIYSEDFWGWDTESDVGYELMEFGSLIQDADVFDSLKAAEDRADDVLSSIFENEVFIVGLDPYTPHNLTGFVKKITRRTMSENYCVYSSKCLKEEVVKSDAKEVNRYVWNKILPFDNLTDDDSWYWTFNRDIRDGMSAKLVTDEIDVPDNAKRVGQYVMFDRKFENLTLSPRQDMKMVEALIEVKPLLLDAEQILDPYKEKFQEIEEYYGHKFIEGKDGIVTTDADDEEVNKTMVQIYEAYMKEANEQIFHLYAQSSTNLVDGLYKVVAIFLGLDEFYEDHMMQYSVLTCMISLIIKYPELFNEVETVFIK